MLKSSDCIDALRILLGQASKVIAFKTSLKAHLPKAYLSHMGVGLGFECQSIQPGNSDWVHGGSACYSRNLKSLTLTTKV